MGDPPNIMIAGDRIRSELRRVCSRTEPRRTRVRPARRKMRTLWLMQRVTCEVRIATYTRDDDFESALQIADAEVAVAPIKLL